MHSHVADHVAYHGRDAAKTILVADISNQLGWIIWQITQQLRVGCDKCDVDIVLLITRSEITDVSSAFVRSIAEYVESLIGKRKETFRNVASWASNYSIHIRE